jgi:hypothetical protein
MCDAAQPNISEWFVDKWRRRLADTDSSYFCVATQMRKQGIPLDIALAVLRNGPPSTAPAPTAGLQQSRSELDPDEVLALAHSYFAIP